MVNAITQAMMDFQRHRINQRDSQIEELISTQHSILIQVFMETYKDHLGNIPKDQVEYAIVNTPYIPTISVNVYLAGIFRDLDDAYNKPLFPDAQY